MNGEQEKNVVRIVGKLIIVLNMKMVVRRNEFGMNDIEVLGKLFENPFGMRVDSTIECD